MPKRILIIEDEEDLTRLLVCKKKDQNLTINIPQRVNPIQGDIKKLTLVVTNLLDNAVKYTPHWGSVMVHSQPEQGSTFTH